MIEVGVFGAGGRMGLEVCRAVEGDPDLSLVAAVDPLHAGKSLRELGMDTSELVISSDVQAIRAAGATVAVDFTVAEAAVENIRWCIENSVHVVVGTTGLTPQQIDGIRLLAEQSKASVLIAPNFAIGAVLMMQFSRQAATWLPEAEIIELHHTAKKDAPSGTAIKTVEEINEGRKLSSITTGLIGGGVDSKAETTETISGARGATKDEVHIHSVRLPGLVAHQEVIFGGQGQTLSIRHDSTDRTSFMPGVLLAIKKISGRVGLTYGLEHLLELPEIL